MSLPPWQIEQSLLSCLGFFLGAPLFCVSATFPLLLGLSLLHFHLNYMLSLSILSSYS